MLAVFETAAGKGGGNGTTVEGPPAGPRSR